MKRIFKQTIIYQLLLIAFSSILLIACQPSATEPVHTISQTLSPTNTDIPIITNTNTFTPEPSSTFTSTPKPTDTPTNTASPTPNLFQFNGYWLSPIEKNTNAYISTFGNVCKEYLDGTDQNCIENWRGDEGTYPADYERVRVRPYHTFGWDFRWEDQGVNVYAVQGGKISEVRLDKNTTNGVIFFIIDENWDCADYGHININSLVENEQITEDQRSQILSGASVDGGWVQEGQLLGVTGDNCCPFGVLHISTCYNLGGIDPGELWEEGEWPDFDETFHPVLRIP